MLITLWYKLTETLKSKTKKDKVPPK